MSPKTVTPEDTQPLLSPAEAARLANVSTKMIHLEIDRGAFPALHAGRPFRIDRTSADGWKADRMRLARVAPRGDGPVASAAGRCLGGGMADKVAKGRSRVPSRGCSARALPAGWSSGVRPARTGPSAWTAPWRCSRRARFKPTWPLGRVSTRTLLWAFRRRAKRRSTGCSTRLPLPRPHLCRAGRSRGPPRSPRCSRRLSAARCVRR